MNDEAMLGPLMKAVERYRYDYSDALDAGSEKSMIARKAEARAKFRETARLLVAWAEARGMVRVGDKYASADQVLGLRVQEHEARERYMKSGGEG